MSLLIAFQNLLFKKIYFVLLTKRSALSSTQIFDYQERYIDVLYHSHKKRKDSLEGSLDWILFTGELEFPKILVPRPPQNISNVKTECAGKSKQLYSLCDQLLGALMYLNFTFLILMFLNDYVWCKQCNIWFSSARTTLGVTLYRSLTLEEKHCCSYYSR